MDTEKHGNIYKGGKKGISARWNARTFSQDHLRVRKTDTFIVFYLFVLYSVTCLKTCHFTAYFTSLWAFISVSILILHVTTWRFCLYVLIFITLLTHFHTHIQRHTHAGTYLWSAQKRNGDNQAQSPVCERQKKAFVTDKGLAHTHAKKMSANWYLKSKKKIQANRASSNWLMLLLLLRKK